MAGRWKSYGSARPWGTLYWPVAIVLATLVFRVSGVEGSMAAAWAVAWPWLVVLWWIGRIASDFAGRRAFRFTGGAAVWMGATAFLGTAWTGATHLMPEVVPYDVGFGTDLDLFDLLGENHVFSESFEWPLPEGTDLEVRNGYGTVQVRPSADRRVRLELRKIVRAPTRGDAGTLASRLEFGMESGESLGVIRSNGPQLPADIRQRFRTSMTVWVPSGVRLVVENGRGLVDVAGVDGPLRLFAYDGDIVADPVVGAVEAHAVRGDADVVFGRAPAAPVALDVTDGDARLELPPGSAFSIEGRIREGDFVSDFAGVLASARPGGMGTAPASDLIVDSRVGSGSAEVTFDIGRGNMELRSGPDWSRWLAGIRR